MTDLEHFPHPVYRDTVLAPLFEGVKAHHAGGMDAINRAHLVMLVETGILTRDEGAAIALALDDIARELDPDALTYTGEFEDWFFLVEAELRTRLGDLGGALHTARSRNDMDHTLFKMALRGRGGAAGRTGPWPGRRAARQGAGGAGYAHRGLHARAAGAAFDLRALPVGGAGGAAARRGPPVGRRRCPRTLADGRGRDHNERVSHRPGAGGRPARLRGRPAQFLRLHRLGRLRDRALFRDQAALRASGPPGAGPGLLVGLRGGPAAPAGEPGAGQLDHAAEAQPGAHRASAPPGRHDRRALRRHGRHDAQHALHRHERQRGRGAGGGLCGLRQRRADAGPAGRRDRRRADRRRPGAAQRRRRLRDDHRTRRHDGARGGADLPRGPRDRGGGGPRRRRAGGAAGRRVRDVPRRLRGARRPTARPGRRGLRAGRWTRPPSSPPPRPARRPGARRARRGVRNIRRGIGRPTRPERGRGPRGTMPPRRRWTRPSPDWEGAERWPS